MLICKKKGYYNKFFGLIVFLALSEYFGQSSETFDRELFIHRKAPYTVCAFSTNGGLDNFITEQILFSLCQKPILQLDDSCTYGTIAFLCMKSSLPLTSQ